MAELTWQEKAKLESGICELMELERQYKAMKEQIDTKKFQLMGDFEEHGMKVYQFDLNEEHITVEINTRVLKTLNKKNLAVELDVEPKYIKTEFLIESAANGKLDVDTYASSFISEPKEELKIKKKKIEKSTKKD